MSTATPESMKDLVRDLADMLSLATWGTGTLCTMCNAMAPQHDPDCPVKGVLWRARASRLWKP